MMIVKNRPNISNWNWDSGYKAKSSENEYPTRVADSGRAAGLELSLVSHKQDHTVLCNEHKGFLVILSSPGSLFDTSMTNFQAYYSEDILVSVEPKLSITSDVLRSYDPAQRECFFSSERPLRFFKTYTLWNCKMECVANFTQIQCGCVPYYLPRTYHIYYLINIIIYILIIIIDNLCSILSMVLDFICAQLNFPLADDNSTKICGAGSLKCYKAALKMLLHRQDFYRNCNCLDSCKVITYRSKADKVKFNWTAISRAKGNSTIETG